jgi:hypothetical protein
MKERHAIMFLLRHIMCKYPRWASVHLFLSAIAPPQFAGSTFATAYPQLFKEMLPCNCLSAYLQLNFLNSPQLQDRNLLRNVAPQLHIRNSTYLFDKYATSSPQHDRDTSAIFSNMIGRNRSSATVIRVASTLESAIF